MFSGRRFQPGLVPTLAALVVVLATVSLGNWQSRRADLRDALEDRARAMALRPPVAIARAADVSPDQRYARATAAGEYVAAAQVWLDNRTYQGVAGYHILTPLRLDDGTHLLVDRGWVPATPRHEPPVANPPTGRIEVTGRLNEPPPKFIELKHMEPTGRVVQNLDLAELAKFSGMTFAPLILEQAPGGADGLLRNWPAPDLGRDKNVSYMWQWYGFASLAAALWLILGWRKK
jgi:surfeit locus 1 family protein